jgi:hypothetical protein
MGSDKMRGKRWVSAREAEAARVAQQSSVYGDNNTTTNTNTNTTINGPLITVTGSSEEWGGGGDNRTVDGRKAPLFTRCFPYVSKIINFTHGKSPLKTVR